MVCGVDESRTGHVGYRRGGLLDETKEGVRDACYPHAAIERAEDAYSYFVEDHVRTHDALSRLFAAIDSKWFKG